jgi:hypothetical protein
VSWSSDPAHDYDRWCDRQESGFRAAVAEGRLVRCAGTCGEYLRDIPGYRPKTLDGEPYCAKCLFAELERRKKEKKVA